jgi:hypothetical protein
VLTTTVINNFINISTTYFSQTKRRNMKLINKSNSPVYTSLSGHLRPGRSSADNGGRRGDLANVMSNIVKLCGNNMYIVLNDAELNLVNKIMDLHKKGKAFKVTSIPKEIYEDPYNRKAVVRAATAAQAARNEVINRANRFKHNRNAMVNGEIKDADGNIKRAKESISEGFASILEENKAIASGKKSPIEAANPLNKDVTSPVESRSAADLNKKYFSVNSETRQNTSTLDTSSEGKFKHARGSDMDKLAMETAKSLEFGSAPSKAEEPKQEPAKEPAKPEPAADEAAKPAKKGRGKGKKAKAE